MHNEWTNCKKEMNGMSKVEFQHYTGKYTLLGLTDNIPSSWKGNEVVIDGKKYKTEIVYDLPNCCPAN